ncbi:potassium/proton antiporter [Virgibacillus sp. YIM 98842]|uniref:potassium/proton antiporter n=1 Tax=Virgibacillus sp. YIM 98842 TaxID=2663533 RepID=UPI0013DBF166|nr:potassium/proton antiporter [Virgibacillus sp. YIM 98842]
MLEQILNSNLIILAISIILITSILSVQFSVRINAPSLIFFISLGMIVGGELLGLVSFDDPAIAQLIGMMALVIILFDGGMKTNWQTIRPVAFPALSLATIGVFITSIILGAAAKLIFDFSWPEALLMGAIVGSTDAAAVFAMLQGRNITKRLEATLEAESGANDPMAVFLTTSFIAMITAEGNGIIALIWDFFWQMGIALLLGLFIGKLGSKALYRITLSSSGLYPLLAISFAFFAFSVSELANASGLLAVYVSAIVIGNSGLKQRNAILRFNEGFTWIAQIGLFFILGLIVIPSDLFSIPIILQGLLLSVILMLAARPIAVFISVAGMKFSLKEKVFLSWAGLRGAVPIVLALFPMLAGLEYSQLYFNIIFFIVLTSVVIQGSTMQFAANKLGLVTSDDAIPLHTMDLLSVGKKDLEIVEYFINDKHIVTGKSIKQIELPDKANIILIIRHGETIPPTAETVLQKEDILYILVPDDEMEILNKKLAANSPSNGEG